MACLKLSLLGPFQVFLDGEAVTSFESNKVRALLAVLAAEGERPQRRELLADLLWPDWPQQAALRNLTYALADLRKNIRDRTAQPPFLLIYRDNLQLNPLSDIWVDVRELINLPDPNDLASLKNALDLYRGSFLEGFSLPDSGPFEDWLAVLRERYQRQMLQALSALVSMYAQRGEYEQALTYARRQTEIEPWLEEAHQQVMRLLTLTGQRGAALVQYEACRKALKNEFGVGPGVETVRLYEAIRDGTLTSQKPEPADLLGEEKTFIPPEISTEYSPPETHKAPRTVLPVQMSTFIGRQREIAQVKEMLEDNRLVTLTGAGGTGKTRLALQAAAESLDSYEDGIFFVDLSPIRDPDLVLLTIAGVLGVRETEGTPLRAALEYSLRERRLLLILDNFEPVLPAAGVVIELLATAPSLKVLVTSRASLQVSGERVYQTPPLVTPNPEELPALEQLAQVESVALFLQRAQTVHPGFTLTQANAPAIAAICASLDGSPLEIELAAARLRLLTPEALLSNLDQRLGFLTSGARDAPARQRSLRATIDWSYNLLPEAEQNMFRRLAVFEGGFTLEAAERVTAAPVDLTSSGFFLLDTLEALTNHSLVRVSDVGGQPRFSMLETIREYALERLVADKADDDVRKQHAGYFLELAERSHAGFRQYGAEQAAWVERLELEQGNLRAALTWTIEHDPELGLSLVIELGEFWEARGSFVEGQDWLSKALARSAGLDELKSLRAWAMNWKGRLCRFHDPVAAQDLQQDSLALFRELGDIRGIAYILCDLGAALVLVNNSYAIQQARSLCQEGMALFRQTEDEKGLAWAYVDYSLIYSLTLEAPDDETFLLIVTEGLRLNRKIGNQTQAYRIMERLGLFESWRGHYSVAQPIFEENLRQARAARDAYGIVANLDELGWLMKEQGEYNLARIYLEESLEIWRGFGCKNLVVRGQSWLVIPALQSGDEPKAAELYQKYQELGGELNETGKLEMCTYSFGLGRKALRLGYSQWAAVFLRDAIQLGQELHFLDLQIIAGSVVESAGVALAVAKPEQAAWLLGVASVLLSAANHAHFEADQYAAVARDRVGENAFDEAWKPGEKLAREDLDKTVDETLTILEAFIEDKRFAAVSIQSH